MTIEPCIGHYAVTATAEEEITPKTIQTVLKSQAITWQQAVTRHQINDDEVVYTWLTHKIEHLIRLNFRQSYHPFLMALMVKVLNNWGYDVEVINGNQTILFPRPKIFYETDISKMMAQE